MSQDKPGSSSFREEGDIYIFTFQVPARLRRCPLCVRHYSASSNMSSQYGPLIRFAAQVAEHEDAVIPVSIHRKK